MIADRKWTNMLPWVTAFAIAMAFLESAVVIYLRQLYYPTGFRFPIAPLDPRIAFTELLRELATMVMLFAPGALLSRNRIERFAWFCFCFGVWDIFYYVFLKAILDWPQSLFDRDILFLVPVVWVGPVLAPCIVSIGLVVFAGIILLRSHRSTSFGLRKWHWAILSASGGLVLYTFIEGPCMFMLNGNDAVHASSMPVAGYLALDQLRTYFPQQYAWPLFIVACSLASGVLIDLVRRGK